MSHPSSRPRAVIIQHEDLEGPGRLAPALRRAGFALERRRRAVSPSDAEAELVVVMGGPMGVYDVDRFPFLREEIALLKTRLEAGRPSLGICLGAQLLAAAAGSRVYPGAPGMVIGVLPVTLSAEAMADPLFAGFDERFETVHWHGDTFDPVPGAVLLASTARYPWEAFRLGRSFALQFHPELDEESFSEWVRSAPEDVERSGRRIEDLLARDLPLLRAAEHANLLLLERLAEFFARDVRSAGGERFLFTVERMERIDERAVVLAPGIPRRTPIVRVGERIELSRPDGSRLGATVRGLAAFGEAGAHLPLLVQLDDSSADVPPGTDALTRAPRVI
jgi:GMP synthase (glutamine-hydrolysing)